jgi:hypothetical protein
MDFPEGGLEFFDFLRNWCGTGAVDLDLVGSEEQGNPARFGH